jgi:hypothetical protein
MRSEFAEIIDTLERPKFNSEKGYLCSETMETGKEYEDIPLSDDIHLLDSVVAVARCQD